jgi:hypothetical protein
VPLFILEGERTLGLRGDNKDDVAAVTGWFVESSAMMRSEWVGC